jgi:hypothetical protein
MEEMLPAESRQPIPTITRPAGKSGHVRRTGDWRQAAGGRWKAKPSGCLSQSEMHPEGFPSPVASRLPAAAFYPFASSLTTLASARTRFWSDALDASLSSCVANCVSAVRRASPDACSALPNASRTVAIRSAARP